MNTRKEIKMEYKVEINSLNNFKAWSGGLSTLNTVRERGGIDTLPPSVKTSFQAILLQTLKSMIGSGLRQTLFIKH